MRAAQPILKFFRGHTMSDGGVAVSQTPMLVDLSAYWMLDEASGVRADSHSNGLDLTDNNTVGSGAGVDGVQVAAQFVRTSTEFFSRAHNSLLTFEPGVPFTVCFWARRTGTPSWDMFFTKGWPGSAGGEVWCGAYADTTNFIFGARTSNDASSKESSIGGSGTSPADTWAFYVIRFDGVSRVRIHQNDVQQYNDNTWGSAFFSGTNTLRIGTRPGADLLMNGRMSGFGFWKRELGDDEATWLYNSGSAARTYSELEGYAG